MLTLVASVVMSFCGVEISELAQDGASWLPLLAFSFVFGMAILRLLGDMTFSGSLLLFLAVQIFYVMTVGTLSTLFGWTAANPGIASSRMILFIPGGFIFGSEIPTQPGKITTPKVMYFDPEKDAKPSIDMWTTKPGSGGKPVRFRRAGEVKADEKSAV